jgi:DNA-binding response OmpR family regulator
MSFQPSQPHPLRCALIVAPKADARRAWSARFRRGGISVAVASSAADALDVIHRGAVVDCLVVEALLPDGRALDLLTAISRRRKSPPISIVAMNEFDTETIIEAYFRAAMAVPRHCVAQLIDTLLVQTEPRTTPPSRLLMMNAANRSVYVDGTEVTLTTGEWLLLRHLREFPERWQSVRQILRAAFGRDDPTGTELVWKYVSRLRRKLALIPGAVESMPKRGYRLRPDLCVVLSEETSPRTVTAKGATDQLADSSLPSVKRVSSSFTSLAGLDDGPDSA